MSSIAQQTRLNLYKEMKRIRAYEEGIAQHYAENKMRCPTHLSVGQEGVPAALSQILRKDDLAMSTHRGHAHYLGKGGSGPRMLAEIYGKATGCSAGKGGSMHLVDNSVGFKGSTAIVGNTIPVGVGIALALQLEKRDRISVVFLGDAAVEEGAFYESANFAALRGLPVLFVCENNLYSVYSHISVRQPKGRRIFKMVEGMGIHSVEGDGNDVEAAYQLLKGEVDQMRKTGRPAFVELSTYRWREHCGPNYDNNLGYRTEQEFLEWKKKDPILLHEQKLVSEGVLDSKSIQEIDQVVAREIKEAFEFAERSPFPEERDAFKHIFYSENGR